MQVYQRETLFVLLSAIKSVFVRTYYTRCINPFAITEHENEQQPRTVECANFLLIAIARNTGIRNALNIQP